MAIPDSRINDYALYDEQGGFHRLSTYNDSKAIVLFVQGNGCPIVRNALTDFNAIVKDYESEGFTFFMINSTIQDDLDGIRSESEAFDFTVPVLRDNNQLIADRLDITITSEIIVLHPTTRAVIFRGPINNRLDYETQKAKPTETYLRDALEMILQGQVPMSQQELVRGCTVTRRDNLEKDTLSYTADIAPILKDHCIRCHVEGGIAPWAMTDYNTVMGWSSMMEQVLLSKRMPPWKADPDIGTFRNSFALDPEKRRKLIRWINEGMAYGNGNDPLEQFLKEKPIVNETTRVPDTIIYLKKELLPATGIIPYRYQNVKLNLPEKGKWLAGISVILGNVQGTHHITVTSTSKPNLALDRKGLDFFDNMIYGYAIGSPKTKMFPENSGVFLEKGTELMIQTHYASTGKEEVDVLKLALYYHEKKPKKEYYSIAIFSNKLRIEPYAKETFVAAYEKITEDIYIQALSPHMHYRGKQMKITATTPEGATIKLISVPDFNFNWQTLYTLETPIFLPRGTTIKAEGSFDNSYQNPFNPDPTQETSFGKKTTDEMFIGFINYMLADDDEVD